MSTDLPDYRVAPAVGRLHGPFQLRPVSDRRREAATRAGARDAAEQAAVLALRSDRLRSPAEIERAYEVTSRCTCHFWPRYACHVYQSSLARTRHKVA